MCVADIDGVSRSNFADLETKRLHGKSPPRFSDVSQWLDGVQPKLESLCPSCLQRLPAEESDWKDNEIGETGDKAVTIMAMPAFGVWCALGGDQLYDLVVRHYTICRILSRAALVYGPTRWSL